MTPYERFPEASYPEMWPEMTRAQRLGMWGVNLLLTELFEVNQKVNALVSLQDIQGAEGLCVVEVEPLSDSTGDQRFPGRQGKAGWLVVEQNMDQVLQATSYLFRAPGEEGPMFAFLEIDKDLQAEHWATSEEIDRRVEMMDALTENYLNIMNQHIGDIDMVRVNRQNHGEERYEVERDLLLKGPTWSDYPSWLQQT